MILDFKRKNEASGGNPHWQCDNMHAPHKKDPPPTHTQTHLGKWIGDNESSYKFLMYLENYFRKVNWATIYLIKKYRPQPNCVL